MRAVLSARLSAASLVEVLSEKDDMNLELMQDPDGSRFVIRRHEAGAEREFERSFQAPDLLFAESLEAMQEMYRNASLHTAKALVSGCLVASRLLHFDAPGFILRTTYKE